MKNGGINGRLPTLPNLPSAGGGGDAPTPNPIYGTSPSIDAMFDGDKLSDVVTWGTQGPEGVSVGYEMRLDGGAWVLYDGDTVGETGDLWRVRKIVVLDEFSRPYTSNEVTVQAVPLFPPVNTVAPAISGTLQVGETLTRSTGTWDPAADTYETRWTRDSTPISGATSSTYEAVEADEGHVLGCEVRGTNTDGTSGWVAATGGGEVQPIPIPVPENDVAPAISGTPTEGVERTVSNGSWSNSPDEYEYQWRLNSSIEGTAQAFTPDYATAGQWCSAWVRARKTGGFWSDWVSASGEDAVARARWCKLTAGTANLGGGNNVNGYCDGTGTPPEFGSIDREPIAGETLIATWRNAGDSQFVCGFAGDKTALLAGQSVWYDNREFKGTWTYYATGAGIFDAPVTLMLLTGQSAIAQPQTYDFRIAPASP